MQVFFNLKIKFFKGHKMNLLEKIKLKAKNKGLTLRQVNEKAGLGTNAIYRWKDQTPNIESVKKVADVLGVSTDYLLGKEEKKNEHIDVSKILEADQLYLKNTALSEEDRKRVQSVLSALLNSEEGQQRLRERGYKG